MNTNGDIHIRRNSSSEWTDKPIKSHWGAGRQIVRRRVNEGGGAKDRLYEK